MLLVEDNDRLRRVLQLSLAEIGFAVTAAASGDEARRMLIEGPCPSLLFSDIRMPGQLDGLQLAVWASQRFPDLHVLLQTGFAEDGAGEFPALRKPFTADELLEAILGVLEPSLT